MDALINKNYDASIGAICWMQGESDSTESASREYYANQSFFVSCLRTDLSKYADDKGVYFIDAGIADLHFWKKYEVVNEAKRQFSEESALNMYFSTIDARLTTAYEPIENPDIAHYDSMSELKLGHLFGDCIIKAFNQNQ